MKIDIIASKLGQQLSKVLEKDVVFRIQEVVSEDIVPILKQAYDEAVEEQRGLLIPTDREAAELGIQPEQGRHSIDEDMRGNAYRAVKINDPSSIVNVQSFFRTLPRGTFGNVNISFSKKKFYDAPRSHFINITKESEEKYDHRWMQWFIEGKTISGHAFSSYKAEESRTGQGIMVQGGMWQFKGNTTAYFLIGKSVEAKMTEGIKKFFATRKFL